MPNEPDQRVEEQLKGWAQKRREEAGPQFELHAMRRRLLQDEVARRYRKKSDQPAGQSVGWFKMFWPRFALVGSLCVVLAVGVAILAGLARSRSKVQQLALVRDQEKSSAPETAPPDTFQEGRVRHRGGVDEPAVTHAGEGAVNGPAEARPAPVAPAPANGKPLEREVLLQAESKDGRLNAVDPFVKVEAQNSLNRQPELTSSGNLNEAPAAQAGPAPAGPGSVQENVRSKLAMERYGLLPVQASNVTSRVEGLTDKQQIAAATQASPLALRPGLDASAVRGIGGGATTNRILPGANLAVSRAQRSTSPDDSSVSAARGDRATSGQSAVRAPQRETDGLEPTRAASVPGQTIQRFTQRQTYRVNLNSPPKPALLQSFQVEQIGRQLRVVDADGSVYDGAIETAPVGEASNGAAANPAASDLKRKLLSEVSPTPGAPGTTPSGWGATRNLFFSVSGTNRTLNQMVVFQGSFLADTNQAAAAFVGGKLEAQKTAFVPLQSVSSQSGQAIPNTLIQGQAIIGASNRIEINAAPVPQ